MHEIVLSFLDVAVSIEFLNRKSPMFYQDLKDFMRQAGEVTYTNCHQNRSGEGVAEFGSRGDMEYALDKLDGAELGGRRIRLCEEGKSRGRSRSRSRWILGLCCSFFITVIQVQVKPKEAQGPLQVKISF